MKVFLSYASERYDIAKKIALALHAQGHNVFFDKRSLKPGDEIHGRISKEIKSATFFVCLLSHEILKKDSYVLSEVQIAEKRWKNPTNRVLSVVVDNMPDKEIPVYLNSVEVLKPKGNIIAETLDTLGDMNRLRLIQGFRFHIAG